VSALHVLCLVSLLGGAHDAPPPLAVDVEAGIVVAPDAPPVPFVVTDDLAPRDTDLRAPHVARPPTVADIRPCSPAVSPPPRAIMRGDPLERLTQRAVSAPARAGP
jgi:hypothetical protein